MTTETRTAPTLEPRTLVDASCDCDACVSRTRQMYVLPGRCGNCGAEFDVQIRKGDRAPLSVECPVCEVDGYGWRAFR